MEQRTLNRTYTFEGKGLHTGCKSRILVAPAPAGSGIVFRRTDLGVDIPALADNVSSTARSTTISSDGASAGTIEHLMSALTGMGIDNVLISIDAAEMPILDGSALFYAQAFAADGLCFQGAPREYLRFSEPFEVRDEASGSFVRISPSDSFSIDLEVDFGSRVLGVQKVHWDESMDYASQIASCRTFCFFHELEYLLSQGLVKGGDVDNAIVVVEHPVTPEQVDRVAGIFNQPRLEITPEGYLSNLQLRFPDECGRHKLLDLIGDLRLCGGFMKAHVEAVKPGHSINTLAARAARKNHI